MLTSVAVKDYKKEICKHISKLVFKSNKHWESQKSLRNLDLESLNFLIKYFLLKVTPVFISTICRHVPLLRSTFLKNFVDFLKNLWCFTVDWLRTLPKHCKTSENTRDSRDGSFKNIVKHQTKPRLRLRRHLRKQRPQTIKTPLTNDHDDDNTTPRWRSSTSSKTCTSDTYTLAQIATEGSLWITYTKWRILRRRQEEIELPEL